MVRASIGVLCGGAQLAVRAPHTVTSYQLAPHDGQSRWADAPHWLQNRRPGLLSAPQAAHFIRPRALATEWGYVGRSGCGTGVENINLMPDDEPTEGLASTCQGRSRAQRTRQGRGWPGDWSVDFITARSRPARWRWLRPANPV